MDPNGKKELVWYVRDEKKVPIGMIICRETSEQEASIGYCVLHEKDYGKFSKEHGFRIARGRAECPRRKIVDDYPDIIQLHIEKFLEKCRIVFPEKNIKI